jgi:hypothetical protein
MTVNELIEILQQVPAKTMPVYIEDADTYWLLAITKAKLDVTNLYREDRPKLQCFVLAGDYHDPANA